jgi:hypothetical protein
LRMMLLREKGGTSTNGRSQVLPGRAMVTL